MHLVIDQATSAYDWIIALATIFGSGIIAIIASWMTAHLTMSAHQREFLRVRQAARRDLAMTLAGEIESFIDLTERHNMVNRAHTVLAAIQAGMDVPPQEFVFDDDSPREIFPIYFARLGEIGMLGELGGRVTRFYSRAENLRRNVQQMQRRHRAGVPAAEFAEMASATLTHYTDDLAEARLLIEELRAVPEQ